MALTNFSTPNLDTYFNMGPFYIPDYQRDYAWSDKEEIKDYWEDLCDVIDRDLNDYFIGQIVVHNDLEKKKKYLIDGQQRTVTSFLLLKVLAHFYARIQDDPSCDKSLSKKAKNKEAKINASLAILDKDEYEEKLWLGEADRAYFRDGFAFADENQVLALNPNSEQSISRKNLIKCYRFFHERIDSTVENLSVSASFDKLTEIYDTLQKTFKILYVETTSEEEAFIIFETLNGRGRDLATSDLLKNFLFRSANGKNRNVIKGHWNSMASVLTGLNITNYIRYLWNSGHGFSREKMLYRAITDKDKGISSPADCQRFAKMLADNAGVYRALEHPDEYSAYQLQEVNSEITDLKKLKVSTFYPIMFAMHEQQFSEADTLKVLHALESLLVRDIVIGRKSPNSYELKFAKIAVAITQMELADADDVVNELLKNCAANTDSVFEEAFTQYVADKTRPGKEKVRFLLRRIENERRREAKLVENNAVVHIEHIMPQTKGSWPVSDFDHESFLWRLGNLTLLDCKLNNDAKNALFNSKKKYYEKSDVKLTKDLIEFDEWRPDYYVDGELQEGEITKRQRELAKLAIKIWKF